MKQILLLVFFYIILQIKVSLYHFFSTTGLTCQFISTVVHFLPMQHAGAQDGAQIGIGGGGGGGGSIIGGGGALQHGCGQILIQ